MTDDGYYSDIEHFSSGYPAGEKILQTETSQNRSGLGEESVTHMQKEFNDYFCPFCGYKLFRGRVRDYKMVCHQCNRLVDSKKFEE